jgi:hypothetical protein
MPEEGEAMASEEVDRRQIIDENESLRDFGLTQAQIDGLTRREKDYALQLMNQPPATFLGYWKTCSLPPCRRAKRCKGHLTERQYREGGYETSFPPCAGKGALRHAEMLQEIRELSKLWKEAQSNSARRHEGR